MIQLKQNISQTWAAQWITTQRFSWRQITARVINWHKIKKSQVHYYWKDFRKLKMFITWINVFGTKLCWNDLLLQTYHSLVHRCCPCSHHSHCTLPTVVCNGSWFYSWTACGCHTDKQGPLKYKRQLSRKNMLIAILTFKICQNLVSSFY